MTELLTELAPSLQKLVDARLDNIDRALLSTDVSRYERRQIVSAVEDQIQELVARINREEPSREDILRILASLDPPEAYGTGSMQLGVQPEERLEPNRLARLPSSIASGKKANTLSIISVSLAGVSLLALLSCVVLGFLAFVLSPIFSLAALICGIVSLCQLLMTEGNTYGKGMSIVGIASFPVGLVLMLLVYVVIESM